MLRIFSRSLFQNNLRSVVQIPSCEYAKKPPAPRKRNPVWFVRQMRTVHEDNITPGNREFVAEAASDRFGVPVLLKNVQEDVKPFEFTPRLRRCGLLAEKIGHDIMWRTNGEKIITTMLHVETNYVIRYTPPDKVHETPQRVNKPSRHGIVLIGTREADPFHFTKEYCGLFKDSGVTPKRHLGRFFVSPEARLTAGNTLDVTHFRVGDFVDASAFTIDRGFQGVMKRWGFKGMPATHGQTKTHRRPGCIGINGMSRVWKGKKMPGHVGNKRRRALGLQVLRINTEHNVMWLTGRGIPGAVGALVHLHDTMLPLKRRLIHPPCPTNFAKLAEHTDEYAEGVHQFGDATIAFSAE